MFRFIIFVHLLNEGGVGITDRTGFINFFLKLFEGIIDWLRNFCCDLWSYFEKVQITMGGG